MILPVIIVNFKGYGEKNGEDPVRLAGTCDEISKIYGISIAVAPRYVDIGKVADAVDVPVLSQHLGPVRSGAYTEDVARLMKEAGAAGSLINHHDSKLDLYGVEKCIKSARDRGLETVCCSDSVEESLEIAALRPDFLAYEPPDLIGGNVSVSEGRAEVLGEIVGSVGEISRGTRVLCGAGIRYGRDVEAALKIGTKGVLVSSAVTGSKDPKGTLKELCGGMYS